MVNKAIATFYLYIYLTDPPPSDPILTGMIPAETMPEAPPLEPPHECASLKGFFGVPVFGFTVKVLYTCGNFIIILQLDCRK
jgi:hypothetical protein